MLIPGGFKSFDFASAHCRGLAGAFFVSAHCKGLAEAAMSRGTEPRLSTGEDRLLGARRRRARSGWAPVGPAIPSPLSRVRWDSTVRPLTGLRAGAAVEDRTVTHSQGASPVPGAQSAPLDSARDSQNELAIHGTAAWLSSSFWFCAFFHLGKESIRKDCSVLRGVRRLMDLNRTKVLG